MKKLVRFSASERNVFLAGKLTDAVHDLLEHPIAAAELRKVLHEAFKVGGSDVWEQAANWLRRLSKKHPDLLSLWLELSQHRSSTVRFRTACCLLDMTPEVAKQVSIMLLTDPSKKVREMTIGKMPSQ
jgi:hypothetical protein